MKFQNRARMAICLCVSIFSLIAITSCGDSERVHESWVTPAEGPHYDDNSILNNFKSRLSADPNLKDLVLNIDVKNGEITIIGMVDNPTLVDQVVMQAWLVDGVKKVDNQIRTKGDL